MLGHGNKNVIILSLDVEVSLKKESVLLGWLIEAIAIDKAKEMIEYSQQSLEKRKKGVAPETSFNLQHQREIKEFIIIPLSWERNALIIVNLLLPLINTLRVKDTKQLLMLGHSILIRILYQQITTIVHLALAHHLHRLLTRMT